MKNICILGGNGFIGHHLARKFKQEGNFVRTVDINEYTYGPIDYTDHYVILDLRQYENCVNSILLNGKPFDEVYNLAAWMGGAGVIFTGNNDAQILHDNLLININVIDSCSKLKIKKLFFSSSACCYNQATQTDKDNPNCAEHTAYPANPDSDYGFEKLMAERIALAYKRNHNLDVHIARFHNIFGPEGAWNNGKEKSPAAMCRKVVTAQDKDTIEIWGDGEQTRSFLYIDECLEGIQRLMNSNFSGPVNIGSEENISINNLVKMACSFENKTLNIKHIDGPLGVRGRNSDNKLIKEKLNWAPSQPLIVGLKKQYDWIKSQVELKK